MDNSVEIWHRYGAYLSGVARIRRDYPKATFEHFINACQRGSGFGGWSREALRNAWGNAQ